MNLIMALRFAVVLCVSVSTIALLTACTVEVTHLTAASTKPVTFTIQGQKEVDSEVCWHMIWPFTFGVEYAQQVQVLISQALASGKGNVLVAGEFRRTEFSIGVIAVACTKLTTHVANTDFRKH